MHRQGELLSIAIAKSIIGIKNYFIGLDAMRVSFIEFALDNLKDLLEEVKRSAKVTHNHREGIKGTSCCYRNIFSRR